MVKLFISSVQREFEKERREIAAYIRQDAVMGRFFEPFLFEELPAKDVSAQQAYLTEVAETDVYLGLFGVDYGYEDAEGVSPTEREYDCATVNHKYRVVLIKRADDRHPKEKTLIRKAEQDVVRNMFGSLEELKSGVYAALVHYLVLKGYLHYGPFDAALNMNATIDDLDKEKIRWWTGMAREKRNFPLLYSDENVHRILNSLHLISDDGRVTNAALLLFAKDPQKWFVSSTVKCVQFYGTKVQKPLASQQIYGGSVFEVVDQAVAFVMSHIDARVGERTQSAQVDVSYELPLQAVTESIVNAVIHRDYMSTGSVQMMLFKDRLEVWNPGRLPKGMTVEKLAGEHASLPVNPLLANPVYLAGYIEQVGTGTNDMIDRCVELGLRKPEFRQDENFTVVMWRKEVDGTEDGVARNQASNQVSNQVNNQVNNQVEDIRLKLTSTQNRIITFCTSPRSAQEIMDEIGVTNQYNNRQRHIVSLVDMGVLAMTQPDSPKSPTQKYYLTELGKALLEKE